MAASVSRKEARHRRHLRVRKKVFGTPDRPRLNVFRSARHIYAQVIDDTKGHTYVAASTLDPELRGQIGYGGNVEAARKVGELVAKRALEKGSRRWSSTAAGICTTAGCGHWRMPRGRRAWNSN